MQKRLSDRVADDILTMIMIEKKFLPGKKLPNEIELSEELKISRTTLREAIRILVANGVVEIRRGLGTFVREDFKIDEKGGVPSLAAVKTDIRDLYEMRLIVEPEAAYYAAMRASDEEIEHILDLGQQIEDEIRSGKDRTETERSFHKAIAKATHNEFHGYDGEDINIVFEQIRKIAYEKFCIWITSNTFILICLQELWLLIHPYLSIMVILNFIC